ncbi:fimbrial protein [Buttiauxella brennerae]|uniref:fimbrial protein n=1 Tax=Buttiauxella brennerae TaxID=82988 RepID=UPI00286F60C3|nr:fimbrial protein [Buttiauxella brennerae]
MKKNPFRAELFMVATAVSISASADNTIKFQGEVANQTCMVSINGNESDAEVMLPMQRASGLAIAGDTAGDTEFTLSVSGCTSTETDAAINTVFVGNNLTSHGRIGNTGTAKNVTLRLFDPAAPAAALDLTGQIGGPGLSLAAGTTDASHHFAVQYYAEGPSTPGTVLGSVQYAISYK